MATGLDDLMVIDLTIDYLDQLELLGRAVGEAIRDVFMNLSDYDRSELAEFIERITPMARAGAAEGADLASVYLAELEGALPAAVELDLEAALPALDGPFLRHWHLLKEGEPWEHSRGSGATQAEFIGHDSVKGGGAERMGKPGTKVIGYQRILNVTACEWCQVVATKFYKSMQSASFGHLNCKCHAVAVTEKNAEAVRRINGRRLDKLKKSGGVQRATDAAKRSRERKREAASAAMAGDNT